MNIVPTGSKYRLNVGAAIRSRIRTALRHFLSKLPSSLSETQYQASLIKYDKRAGSYVGMFESDHQCIGVFDGTIQEMSYKTIIDAHLSWLANNIIERRLNGIESFLEVGAGELTTIAPLIQRLNNNIEAHASELSWSRLHVDRDFFNKRGINFSSLATASVLELPYRDNAFDCVMVHYCLEELSGYQETAIKELIRVSRKYVVIVEASYELGNKYQRRKLYNRQCNMEILPAIHRNKWRLMEHSLVPYCNDAYHHGAIHILKKDSQAHNGGVREICCPKCKGHLVTSDTFLSCKSCSLVYPVIEGIPVMLSGNAIVASRFQQ